MSDHMDDAPRAAPEDLAADRATGDESRDDRFDMRDIGPEEVAAATLHASLVERRRMSPALADRLAREGEALVVAHSDAAPVARTVGWRLRPLLAIAAVIAVAAVAIVFAAQRSATRAEALRVAEEQIAALRERIESNDSIVAAARSRVATLEGQLAATAAREVELAAALAAATEGLEAAELRIARYEQPVDPDLLQDNRRLLLATPGTVRLAWSPFDLPDAPAEQRDVSGDVVWNDELQQGYLRFVGLDPNDPNIEQYQVWIIDERGMEQKVSGGVFDVTARGEVIVPIAPGIDVGRVALFAVTVEDPGGTWVPDLRRRVVVAPREGG